MRRSFHDRAHRAGSRFLVACGGSSNSGGDVTAFVGVYATTSHTRAETPGSKVSCVDPGQAVAGSTPFFRLAVDTFFMDPDVLRLRNCSDTTEASCQDTSVTLRAGGPGLLDESANTQTGGGVMCQLYFMRAEAKLTGATLQVNVEQPGLIAAAAPLSTSGSTVAIRK